jgi:dihydropteroate synthase
MPIARPSASSPTDRPSPWQLRGQSFHWGERTYLIGILNLTPDSFSDGGQYNSLDRALEQAQSLAAAGSDILDLGGQSSRPGAIPISLAEELERVIPVIEALRAAGLGCPISIDTTRAEVAAAAIAAGADLVNDISAGLEDAEMLPTVARLGVPIILMHRRGTAQTMQSLTTYHDLLEEIEQFLGERIKAAISAGVDPGAIAIDPGIGFAKTGPQNLELLRQMERFCRLGYPVLVGPSRKSFIGAILNQPDPRQRVWGTAAACCAAIAGGADLLRIHDLSAIREVSQVADAIWRNSSSG